MAASDAPGLRLLWHHNGSRLRVQARLSRIYIYINAANPPSCSAAEESAARREAAAAAAFTSSSLTLVSDSRSLSLSVAVCSQTLAVTSRDLLL